MRLKKLVPSALLLSVGVITVSSAQAAAYVSDGMSFASMATDVNTERVKSGSFEFLASGGTSFRQAGTSMRDQSLDDAQPTVASSHATKSSNWDSWLMLLVGSGLVALQLRRKQKSLPHQSLKHLAVE